MHQQFLLLISKPENYQAIFADVIELDLRKKSYLEQNKEYLVAVS